MVPPGQAVVVRVVRIACHATVWLIVLVPTAVQLERGWFPVGDNAFLASRAYEVFSAHTPLVGMYTTGLQATGHRIYDLGPLESWLLALPVRLSPGDGPLWGAAIACGAALSLSVEALWRHRGWRAAVMVPFVVGDLCWQANLVFTNLIWNAYFGLLFFVATVAIAWVVACGRRSWWPALVFTASVAAQSHLLFALPSAALVAAAPFLGRAARRAGGWRWMGWGLGVGAALWTAPLVQQVTGRPGNLTQLLRYGHSLPTAGVGYGLRMLTVAASPKPIVLTRFPSSIFADFRFIDPRGPAAAGAVVLVTLVAVWVVARRHGRADLAALAAVTAIVAAGTAFGFSSIFRSYLSGASYLVFCLWLLGFLLWTTWIWAGAAVVGAVLSTRSDHGGGGERSRGPVRRAIGPFGAALLVGGAVTASAGGLAASFTPNQTDVGASAPADVRTIAHAVEEKVPERGPVGIVIGAAPASGSGTGTGTAGSDTEASPGFLDHLSNAVAYQLTVDGWQPGLERSVSPFFALPESGWPVVRVTLAGASTRSVLVPGSHRVVRRSS